MKRIWTAVSRPSIVAAIIHEGGILQTKSRRELPTPTRLASLESQARGDRRGARQRRSTVSLPARPRPHQQASLLRPSLRPLHVVRRGSLITHIILWRYPIYKFGWVLVSGVSTELAGVDPTKGRDAIWNVLHETVIFPRFDNSHRCSCWWPIREREYDAGHRLPSLSEISSARESSPTFSCNSTTVRC